MDKTLGRLLYLMLSSSLLCSLALWQPGKMQNYQVSLNVFFNPYSCFGRLYNEFRQKQTWSRLTFKDGFKSFYHVVTTCLFLFCFVITVVFILTIRQCFSVLVLGARSPACLCLILFDLVLIAKILELTLFWKLLYKYRLLLLLLLLLVLHIFHQF